MIYGVEVSEQADSDLREIFEYIAFELQSPEIASRQLNRLEKHILSLDTMPKCYQKYEKETCDILVFHISYLKHHVKMAFPSVLAFKNLPEEIEYEITLIHTEERIG